MDPLFRRNPRRVEDPDIEGPPLTDDMVAMAERDLGVTLPAAYLEVLRVCNGGYITDAVFPTAQPTMWAQDHVPMDAIFGIPSIGEHGIGGTGAGILQTRYMVREWDLPDGLVLLNGDGHWWIALDYRASGPHGEPSVAWLAPGAGEDIRLADDVATFLAGLVPGDTDADD